MELASLIILAIVALAAIGLCGFTLIVLTKNHQEEKRDLHNRLMSREYPEYLHGKHTEQILKSEEEKAKNKPKEYEKTSKEFEEHKRKAEKY